MSKLFPTNELSEGYVEGQGRSDYHDLDLKKINLIKACNIYKMKCVQVFVTS